ncbi:MAG: helix-turn-helix domain-containing protein [Coriobacteriia bacterium]|nr:helix-turn-helix domain-containing protein [Coriobacteriia bacterium]
MPVTAGEMLRAERKTRGLTTLDIAVGTRIMQSSIQALEDDDYEHLPAPGYVRGYILSYCRFLRLEAGPFLHQYEIDTGNKRQNTIDDLAINNTAVAEAHDQHDIPWRTAIILGIILLLIVVGVFIIIAARNNNNTSNPLQTPPPSQETTAPASSGDTTASPKSGGTGAAASDSAQHLTTQPFSFTIQAKDGTASDLTVICDGVQAYSGSFTSGMKETFMAQQTAVLTIANPAALTVTRGGKAVAIPRTAPATVTLRATAK